MNTLERLATKATADALLAHSLECDTVSLRGHMCELTDYVAILPQRIVKNIQVEIRSNLTTLPQCAATKLIILVLCFQAVRPICLINQCSCLGAGSSLKDAVGTTCYHYYKCDCFICADDFFCFFPYFRERIQTAAFIHACSYAHTLTTLHIGLLSEAFVVSLHQFEKLKHLRVQPFTIIEKIAFRENLQDFLSSLPSCCQHLEELHLVTASDQHLSISPATLELIKYNRSLRNVNLILDSVNTDLGVCLIHALPKLKSLSLKSWERCFEVDRMFQKLQRWVSLQVVVKTLKWESPVDICNTSTEFLRGVCGIYSPVPGSDYDWREGITMGWFGHCVIEGTFGPCTTLYIRNPFPFSLLVLLSHYFVRVTEVHLVISQSVLMDWHIIDMVTHCKHLETLEIVASDVYDSCVIDFADRADTRIKTLEVKLRNATSQVIVKLMKFVSSSSSELQKVEMHFGYVVVTEWAMVDIFLENRREIESLCVTGFNLVLTYPTLLDFIIIFPNLKRIGYVNTWRGFFIQGNSMHEFQGKRLIEERGIKLLRCQNKRSSADS